MGACDFYYTAEGVTAKDAFKAAVQQAQYDHGHAGCTGTIAEKEEFVLIEVPSGWDPRYYAKSLIDAGDPRVDDKWGPAGCIALGKGKYLFFGWASS